MGRSLSIVLFWKCIFLILLVMAIYFLVLCMIKKSASGIGISLNIIRILKVSTPFFKKVLVFIPKFFLLFVILIAVVYLLLVLIINLHFILFNTWDMFLFGSTIDSSIAYNLLTFKNFLSHFAFVEVYVLFFYDSLWLLLEALRPIFKDVDIHSIMPLIWNVVTFPLLVLKFILQEICKTIFETNKLIDWFSFNLTELFYGLYFLSQRSLGPWVPFAVFNLVMLLTNIYLLCCFIYALHDHNYYKYETRATFLLAVICNIFYFFLFLMSLTTLWNIFMHMDKFLAVNYGYQVKLNSSIISDCVSFSFFDWCHFINNLSHQIKSLEPIGPDDFISTLTSSGIFEYVLVGTGIATLFVAWIWHLLLNFEGTRFIESTDIQCTEIKRLTKEEVKRSEKSNASLYLIGFSFTLFFCLGFFNMNFSAKFIFDFFLIPSLITLVNFANAVLYLFEFISFGLRATAPNLYHYMYLFFFLSLCFHIVIKVYLRCGLVKLWQISQDFGTRDPTIQDDHNITIIDPLLLFFSTLWLFFKYYKHEQVMTFYDFLIERRKKM